MFYNLGIAGPGDAPHRCDRVRDDDRARPARCVAHRQDQGDGDPGRQEPPAALRRDRRRRAPDRPHRALPGRHQSGVESGQGRTGAFAGRGGGQAAALRPDRHPPGHAAGSAAGAGDAGSHRGARRDGTADRQCHREPQHPGLSRSRRPGKGRRGRHRRRLGAVRFGNGRDRARRRRLRRPADRDHPARHPDRRARPRTRNSSTRCRFRDWNCRRSPTASTWAACTNSRKHLHSRGFDDYATAAQAGTP